MPFARLFALLLVIAVALQIHRRGRHKRVHVDEGVLAAGQRDQEGMRSLGRRVVEDGQRHESRELHQGRSPLDVEREAEEVCN